MSVCLSVLPLFQQSKPVFIPIKTLNLSLKSQIILWRCGKSGMQPKVLTFTKCHSDGVKLKLGPTKCFIKFYLFCLYGLLLQILSHSIMLSVVWLRKRQPTICPFCTARFVTVMIIVTLTHPHSVDAALQLSSFQNSNFMNKEFRGRF